MADAKLLEMGQVIADSFGTEVDPETGVVSGPYDRWTPIDNPDLDRLKKAMHLAGIDAVPFRFQAYEVVAANPYHGGKIDLKFPSQMVIKGPGYARIHQIDLVLRSPFVAATEILTAVSHRK